jgi:hypothetical protein
LQDAAVELGGILSRFWFGTDVRKFISFGKISVISEIRFRVLMSVAHAGGL